MIFGALIVILILVSLVFVIIPVLRQPSTQDSLGRDEQNIVIARDKKAILQQQLANDQMSQQEFDAAMTDLEVSLAIDLERQQSLQSNQNAGKWAIWVFAALIPVLSIYMYWQLGEYRVIENPSLAQARTKTDAQTAAHGQSGKKAPSMAELVQKVKDHLRENPDDARGWFMLGRTYLSLQQYPEAVAALQRSYDLSPEEPAVLLALADGLAMTQNGSMAGEAEHLVKLALKLVPENPTALWLAGLAAEQGGRNREAFDYWMSLLPLLDKDPQSTSEVKTLLTELKQKHPELPELDFPAQAAAPSPMSSDVNSNAVASTGTGVAVSVTLDPQFSSKVSANDLLFIYAKAASGPPMPLAAKRLKVSDLPVKLTLSDADAMMPQMKLSSFDDVVIGARISRSGNPVAQAGDLYYETTAMKHKGFDGVVELNINKIK
jgi:cytochrome c-type biogenesis protein CcmH